MKLVDHILGLRYFAIMSASSQPSSSGGARAGSSFSCNQHFIQYGVSRRCGAGEGNSVDHSITAAPGKTRNGRPIVP